MKIKELIKYGVKSQIKAGDAVADGKYQFFTSSEAEDKRYNQYSHDTEGIIMGTGGNATLHYYNGKFAVSTDCLVLETNEKINCKYLYYFFRANMGILQDGFKGAGLKHTNKKYIENIELNLLPRPEKQLEIIKQCEKIESIINKHNKIINYLDTLTKARFVEMFGEPGKKHKNYELKYLKDCCVVNPAKNNDIADSMKVSFVPMTAVSEKGEIESSNEKEYREVKKGFTYFKENDVLFAKITPCMENGKGAIAVNLINGIGVGSTEFHVMRPIENISNSYWLYVLTTTDEFRTGAKKVMTGTGGQLRVPADYLKNYRVLLPPIELQYKFAEFYKHIDKLKFV